MTKLSKSVWFDGSSQIKCNIQEVRNSFNNISNEFVDTIGLMPGIRDVVLVEKGNDFVIIKTNEGIMKRTNIIKNVQEDKVVIEFDEEYQAGKKINVKSHYCSEFSTKDTYVNHHLVISQVISLGVLGFFYRNFGKKNIGKAILGAYKTHFEKQNL